MVSMYIVSGLKMQFKAKLCYKPNLHSIQSDICHQNNISFGVATDHSFLNRHRCRSSLCRRDSKYRRAALGEANGQGNYIGRIETCFVYCDRENAWITRK